MKVAGDYMFDAPQRVVWDGLQDPAVLKATLPGCDHLDLVGENEYDAVLKLIERLKGILTSERQQLAIVIDELEQIRDKFGDPRRTEIIPVEGEISIEDLIKEEEMVITVTHTGYIKRTPLSIYQKQHRGGKGRKGMTTREEDAVRHPPCKTRFVLGQLPVRLKVTSAPTTRPLASGEKVPPVGTGPMTGGSCVSPPCLTWSSRLRP